MPIDLNIENIRAQIDADFKQIPNTETGLAQKNILTLLELRNRVDLRIKQQRERGAFSFNQCLEAWSKGNLTYPELLKKAGRLLEKNAIKSSAHFEEIKEIFNEVGEKPIETEGLQSFRMLAGRAVNYLKNMFQTVSRIFKKHSNQSQQPKPKGFVSSLFKGRRGL